MLLAILASLLVSPVSESPEAAALPDLVARAQAAADSGHPLRGWRMLSSELLGALASEDWDDEVRRAEAEVAALLLTRLTGELSAWPEAAERIAPLRPLPVAVPPRVAFLVERLYGRCLRELGQPDEARATLLRLGYRNDWMICGPFDNERGSGFEVAYEPERSFDRNGVFAGKEREVRWRNNPGVVHPLYRVAVDRTMRPAEQAVAYLATAVRPLHAGPVTLRIGTTCSFKVFLNGAEVASRRVERPIAPDQERIVLDLEEGWNQLLVKLAVEDQSWQFESRFTHLDGRPHRRLVVNSTHLAWPGPPPTPMELLAIEFGGRDGDDDDDDGGGGPPPGVDISHLLSQDDEEPDLAGARSLWNPDGVPLTPPDRLAREAVDILAERTDDGRAMRLLALYHLLVHPDDVVERSALAAAERATALSPDDPAAHYLVARASEDQAATRNEREVNRRVQALQAVLEHDPGYVAALLDLAAFSSHDNPIPSRADSLSAQAVAAQPDSFSALSARADVLDALDRRAEADRLRQRAEATDEADLRIDGYLSRARRLKRHGLVDPARVLLEEAFSREASHRVLTAELVEQLVDHGLYELAMFVTEHALRADPFDLGRMRRTARLVERGPDVMPSRAHELLERVLATSPEHTLALSDLVRIDLREGRIDHAVESLREIVRLDPGDDRSRRHLALLTAEEKERFEEPYRWDAADLVDLPLPETSANDPFDVLDRTVVWRLNADGTEHRYEHLALRVLNLRGVKVLDVYAVQGLPDSELQVYNVRVVHPDGSVEHAPPPRRSRPWVRVFDLPPLQVGDIVDIEYRADQSRADVFGEYFGTRHLFYPEGIDRELNALPPTRRSELVVIAPADVPVFAAERNAEALEHEVREDDQGRAVHRWIARDLPRPPVETAMPRPTEFVPVVDVTTFSDWDAFADWYWHFIEKEFVTTPEMREKVAELTEGLTTEDEKVEAIVRFVGQEIRYNAWSFGTHGYEPYSAATIFERRFGDCKDKSILLRQLLAEVGVEAIPVLIRAEWNRADEPLDAAMVGHFNHCIAYLPPTESRDGLYLDATADLNPVDYLRADDQGARVLHVTDGGGGIREIPYAPADENRFVRHYDVTLDEKGRARVAMDDRSNGHYAVRLRTRLGGEQGDISKLLSDELARGFGKVTVEDVETSDLEDISQPTALTARFSTEELWSTQGDLRALRPHFDDLGLRGLATELPDDRRSEVVLDRPFARESRVTYTLPEGARVVEVPDVATVEESGLLTYRKEARLTDDGVAIERRFDLLTRRIPLERYAAFRDALRRIELAEARVVLIETAPSVEQ